MECICLEVVGDNSDCTVHHPKEDTIETQKQNTKWQAEWQDTYASLIADLH